jgi:hypothetical protein
MAPKASVVAFAILSLAIAGTAQAASKAELVGVVLPSDARPGERASGSIIMYPGAISGISGIHVEKTHLDIDESQPRKAILKGIVIDAGVQKRTADRNFVVDVPPDAKSVHLVLTRDDQQIDTVDVPIEASTSTPLQCGSEDWVNGTEADGSQSQFRTPKTYCYAGMAVITGDFNGDGEQSEVDVGDRKARIVAESRRYCYWLLPRDAAPGNNEIVLHEGSHVVKFKVVIPRLDLLQTLEDEGSSVAEAPEPSAGEAAASDNPAPNIPIGIGIGGGGFGIGGGGNDEPGVIEERRQRLH